jgi:hypothetical protein
VAERRPAARHGRTGRYTVKSQAAELRPLAGLLGNRQGRIVAATNQSAPAGASGAPGHAIGSVSSMRDGTMTALPAPTRDTATLTIVEPLVERFWGEARQTMEFVAGQVEEALRSAREGKTYDGQPVSEPDIEALGVDLSDAMRLVREVRSASSGDLRITADRETLARTIQGCLIRTAEDVAALARSVGLEDPVAHAELRTELATIEDWLDALAALADWSAPAA